MSTKCLIVDDEPLAIEVIENYLDQLEGFEVTARCKNALQAFAVLEKEQVDLVFLDIQMPKLTGIDFVRSLQHPPKIILTTAYIDYAVEGYELDILDYLVKPISFERFFKAISKYSKTKIGTKEKRTIVPQSPLKKDYIYVKANKKNHKILFADILYLESVKDYIKLHLKERRLLVKTTLSDFEAQLPASMFLRVHRSYVVNLAYITAHTTQDIELGAIEIPIGGSYRQRTFERLH